MVIASGMVTSRTSFSFGSAEAWPLSRWVRRRNEATERSRTSSARSAVTSVRRPRCFSAPPRGAAARRGRRTRGAAGTPRRARRFILVGFERHAARGRLLDLVLAEALLGDFAGLALGFFVVLAALVFLALARFGGFALGLVDDLAALAAARLFLGDLALFGFAHARIGQRMGARDALFLGQRAQHDAGRLRLPRRGAARGAALAAAAGFFARLDRRRLGLGLGRSADAAAFDLLDHDLLAAAMAEALAHHARLGARLERQLAETLSFFSPGFFVSLIHVFCPRAPSVGACALTSIGRISGPKAL